MKRIDFGKIVEEKHEERERERERGKRTWGNRER